MKSREIRSQFIKYFESHGHSHLPSSSLIPQDDPTLLFANAGMNQFKNAFLGLEKMDPPRAVTSQKCVRAGGKHNDLENVGFTARHHTFFEMLGNFSFGDYFKKEAIHYAWDLLTNKFAIPKDKLFVTVYKDDDEAADIWHKQEGVPRERIYRFDQDNFWRMGDVGPCGPCTEIFYDHGPEAEKEHDEPTKLGGDGDRYVEIWNLVFMQFYEDGKTRTLLPKPSVDTGGGLERFSAALQGKLSNYETDLFMPIIDKAKSIAHKPYVFDALELKKDPEQKQITAAYRVLADHARSTAMLIADGVLPSNEGRGYVLRRIMRRAIRFGRNLTDDPKIFSELVAVVIHSMGEFYPNLIQRKEVILRNVEDEVTRFLATLDQGTDILNTQLRKLNTGDKLDAEIVFKLYDTFGFPADLTRLIATEKGILVDEKAFEARMEQARQKARSSWKGAGPTGDQQHMIQWTSEINEQKGATVFKGYSDLSAEDVIMGLSDGNKVVPTLRAGETGFAIVSHTPFYAESGGQVGDIGELRNASMVAQVQDVQKKNNLHVLSVLVEEGQLGVGDKVQQLVSDHNRRAVMANHSATHLLHAALRKVLGTHVTQAGSMVSADRLRFDFTHNAPLSKEQIHEIETIVNGEISQARPVGATEKSYDEAIASGAMALFGEKYGDKVRVVQMGEFSVELCGGTHVENTAMIRLFKIVSETGVSAGVRRMEALTGDRALAYFQKVEEQVTAFKSAANIHESWTQVMDSPSEKSALINWLDKNKTQVRDLEKALKNVQSGSIDFEAIVKTAKISSQGTKYLYTHLDIEDRKMLSEMCDRLKDKLGSGVLVVTGPAPEGTATVVSVSKDLTEKYKAGDILKSLAQTLGGKGGGRPDFAQGTLNKIDELPRVLEKLL